MDVKETSLSGLYVIAVDLFADSRGHFAESWHKQRYADMGIAVDFIQDNLSQSNPGILRGLHYRHPDPQGQLVTAVSGKIFDVCVDLRPGSATFGQWHGEELSGDHYDQIYMPPGFAHGFCVLGDEPARVHYKCTELYEAEQEHGVHWADPDIGIEWPEGTWVVSERDRSFPQLKDIRATLASG